MKCLKNTRVWAVIMAMMMILSIFSGCSGSAGSKSRWEATMTPVTRYSFDYLDTFIEIKVYAKVETRILDECFAIIARYDNLLSRTKKGTAIYELNETGSVEMEADVLELLQKGVYYSELSQGAFDITAEPITSQWDFKAEIPVLPDADVLEEAVKHVNYKNLVIEGNKVSLTDPASGVDLGAIAKG